jgi:hypothetical protein
MNVDRNREYFTENIVLVKEIPNYNDLKHHKLWSEAECSEMLDKRDRIAVVYRNQAYKF